MASTEGPALLTALRNELIVEKIFQFLPMKSLLYCSQVCKAWKQQARTYIRDHRKWTVSISATSPCNHLNELDKTIGKMTTVPINSLSFHLKPHKNCRSDCSRQPVDEPLYGRLTCDNLFARMKLKYLSISLEGEVPACPAKFAASRLFIQKGNEIKDLQIGRISCSFAKRFGAIQRLDMLQLEKLQVGSLYDDSSRDFIGKILYGNNPRLKIIINHGDNRIFEIFPQSKLRFLNNFGFVSFDRENVNLAKIIAESRPTLSELNVGMFHVDDHRVPVMCLQIIQSFLQSSFKSMRTLDLAPIGCLKAMSFPPLENLTRLKIRSCSQPGDIRNQLHLIEFGRLFPKLQHVEVSGNEQEEGEAQPVVAPHPEFDNEEVLDQNRELEKTSKTTSFLLLKGNVRCFSFLQLKRNFPEVMDLLICPGMRDAHAVPYRLIFRLWPNLRTLVISGTTLNRLPNCDAEFCGINQDEVELLWSMDDEYLKNVHIVPLRPCVTTMLSLNQISSTLWMHRGPNIIGVEPRDKFLSSVTKFLVFERMPWLISSLNI